MLSNKFKKTITNEVIISIMTIIFFTNIFLIRMDLSLIKISDRKKDNDDNTPNIRFTHIIAIKFDRWYKFNSLYLSASIFHLVKFSVLSCE